MRTALTLRACRSARSFLCPYDGCGFASLTSDDAVWAHAEEEHGIERDGGLCLVPVKQAKGQFRRQRVVFLFRGQGRVLVH